MSDTNYWKNFWNENNIIERTGIHEKIGRTINGVAIEPHRWNSILYDLENHLCLNSSDSVLDIAAGSGAIAIPFSKKVNSYTALDISEKLIEGLKTQPKINAIHADAREVEFEKEGYSKVILYFALQHFTEKETLLLLKKIHQWLKPGGICFVGDIPDAASKFSFFNNCDREKAYFDSIIKDSPIIGTWFDKEFVRKAGIYSGFKESIVVDQPQDYINSHYRFDLKLVKYT
jgi:ubiquinone/menaquinone biosynthesis C-methylase UbiE